MNLPNLLGSLALISDEATASISSLCRRAFRSLRDLCWPSWMVRI